MKDRFESLELQNVKEQIAQHCCFSLGKKKIRQLSPHFEELWVKRELQRTKEAYDLLIRYGAPSFQGLHDTQESIEASKKDATLSAMELRRIADGIRSCEHITSYFKGCDLETPSLKELVDSFSDQRKTASEIERCISVNYEVMDSASAELKSVRKSIRICEGDINKEVQRFIARNASKLMDTITTQRNGRTCVLVKIAEKNSVDGFIHGESASGQTAYIEPGSLLVLNNRLQSLVSKEQEEIAKILFGLSQGVKTVAYELLGNLDTMALLDSIFAKGAWAKKMDGCVATLDTKDEHLYLKDARHPLIEPEKVVANTYEIASPHHSLLITGSNTGGKTVTLKTIGLFVAMTMCGMPVSAQEAIVPLFTNIFVDIGDEQSIQESLSTFSSHISKMAQICAHAGKHSLVLLDELGSGTDPKEGEPLAVAILDELRRNKAMVIATTHYSALKTYASQHEDILLSSVEFDVDAMKPTYRYIEGMSGQSYAFEIAKRYGLKESIIAHAKNMKEEQKNDTDIALEKVERLAMEHHDAKLKLEEKLQDVKQLQEKLEKEKEHLQKEKDKILQEVKDEAQKQLEETKEEAYEVLEQLKQLQSDAKPHEISALKSRLSNIEVEENEAEEEKEESFAVGDYVQLKKLNYYGEILSIQKDKVCVLANHMKMNTTTKEITHATRQVQKKKKSGVSKSRITSFSMECNVIGMRVAEAIPVIDKYLDNAILAKVYQVRIIHGMGTGKLRKGVHDYLKRNQNVESYMMGGQGEGGLGATVVKLKQKK